MTDSLVTVNAYNSTCVHITNCYLAIVLSRVSTSRGEAYVDELLLGITYTAAVPRPLVGICHVPGSTV